MVEVKGELLWRNCERKFESRDVESTFKCGYVVNTLGRGQATTMQLARLADGLHSFQDIMVFA